MGDLSATERPENAVEHHVELFAAEKPHLIRLPLHVPEVYRIWKRDGDAYGCVSVEGFKYPVPAQYIGKQLVVRETKDRIIALDGHREVANHKKKLPGDPPAAPLPQAPRRQKTLQLAEEEKLKAVGEGMTAYMAALKAARGPRYVWSLRKLYQLLCQYKAEDLAAAVAKAAEHRLFDVSRIETILLQDIAARDYYLPLGGAVEDYEKWPQYQAGATTAEPDLNAYAPMERDDDRRDP